MFKTVINSDQTNSIVAFLKDLPQLELLELYQYLINDKNKKSILHNLNVGFAVSVECNEFIITMFSRSEYFVLVASIRNCEQFKGYVSELQKNTRNGNG